MHPNPKRIIPVVIILIVLGGGYYLYSTNQLPFLRSALAAATGNLASGFIEGEEVNIVAEIGGRIEMLAVNEGDKVTAGQEILKLDRTLLSAQLAQAQAAVDTAKAQLAQVKAGARAEDIKQAEAALAQAKVARDGAKKAWENAQLVRDHPQELDARIAQARAQVEVAEHQVAAAKQQAEVAAKQIAVAKQQVEAAYANAKAAEVRKDQFQGPAKAIPEAQIANNQWWAAEAAVNAGAAAVETAKAAEATGRANIATAQASVDGAKRTLVVLNDMRDNPYTLNAQVDAAKAQYDAASAAVDSAQARLDAVKAGATREQIAVAEAVVKQAEAALAVLQAQMDKLSVKSPTTGIVTRRVVRQGEVAGPGVSLLTVTNLDPVKLTIYVPETQLGQIKLGDEIAVQVDSFPKRFFTGKVTYIASQAEFTPRNVQTKAERVNTVFAVKVQIPNEKLELKPGMPADAVLK
jgi:multidrug resistance efflux pump